MNLEVQDKTTSFTFTYSKVVNNLPVTITSAKIIIYNNAGTVLVNEVTLTPVGNTASHTVNFSVDPDQLTWTIARNFKAEFNIDGQFIPQLFDIVKYPFINHVVDEDLFNEAEELKENATAEVGEADSGSTTTLVHADLNEVDDFWNGGLAKIWKDAADKKITEHDITDFDKATNTITFTPARIDPVVSGDNYALRRSYQNDINRAGDLVKEDLLKRKQRAYLVLDDYQLKNLTLYKTLERYFGARKKGEEDIFTDRYNYFKGLYDTAYETIPLNYDADEDGNLDPDTEEAQTPQIKLNR